MFRLPFTLALVAILFLNAALAASDDGATILQITAHAEREVANDLMTVSMKAERRSAEVSQATSEVNRIMRDALEQTRGIQSIDARTQGYSTSPFYDRDRTRTDPVAWQVTQMLELRGKNFEQLTALAAKLQDLGLAIANIQFSISEEIRQAQRQELLLEAIRKWQHTAQTMGAALGASHVLPKQITLHDDGLAPPWPELAMRTADADITSPALEAGHSTLRVTVSGELKAYGAATLRTLERR